MFTDCLANCGFYILFCVHLKQTRYTVTIEELEGGVCYHSAVRLVVSLCFQSLLCKPSMYLSSM